MGETKHVRELTAHELVGVMADKYAMRILALTGPAQLNTYEISERGGIPIAVAYRIVNKLAGAGLLGVLRKPIQFAPHGVWRQVRFYLSRVEQLDCSTTFPTDGSPPKSIIYIKLNGQEPRTLEMLLLPQPSVFTGI